MTFVIRNPWRHFNALAVVFQNMYYRASSHIKQATAVFASLLGLLTLSGCIVPHGTECEGPTEDRVILGVLTLGEAEVSRAVLCPSKQEIQSLWVKAEKGDPEAQYELGHYYINYVRGDGPGPGRTDTTLMLCAAEGGNFEAQWYFVLLTDDSRIFHQFVETEAAKLSYKYSRVLANRDECDCTSPPKTSMFGGHACYYACGEIENVIRFLSSSQIEELEREIADYQPSPTSISVCEAEM